MTPIKVSFLIPDFSDGGAQKQCIYLLNELQTRGDIRLQLIYLHDGVHDALLDRGNIEIHHLQAKSNYSFGNVLAIRRHLKSFKPDLVMSWLHSSDVYAFFLTRLLWRTKWLMTERNSNHPSDLRFWLRKKLGIYADGIASNSSEGDAYWGRNGARRKRFVTGNIVPFGQRNADRNTPRDRSALYVGRLEPQKNVVTVVRAFCLLAQQRPDLRFEIIGKGSQRDELETIIADAGVADTVALLGFKTDVVRFIEKAGVVVSLSHREGLPNVLLESVSVGTPVVASAIAEHQELLGPDYPYYVTDRENPEASAAMILRVLDAGDASNALGYAKARTDDMTAAAIGDKYLQIFRDVIAG